MKNKQTIKPSKRPIHFGAQIVIKFHDYVDLDQLTNIDDLIIESSKGEWAEIKKQYPAINFIKMITSIKEEKLEALINKAAEMDNSYKPVNLKNYYYINCPENIQPGDLLKEIKRSSIIEKAYIDYPSPDPVVNDANDPRAVDQDYLDAAPVGIDARYAWGFDGGDGAGVSFIDMERGWTLNHEDLTAHGISLLHGTLLDTSRAHGTSVLGEICASDNTVGCVGIAPNVASANVVSFNGSTRPNAIIAAVDNLVFGDVLILEAQNTVPGSIILNPDGTVLSRILGPCEVLDADFDAIRLATALGVIVVEAGGNGTNNGSVPPFNLDAYVDPAGNRSLFRDVTNATFRDSGAIIVSASTSAAPHTREVWAPHGNRIDCYAWGRNINTLSSDDAGTTTLYTTSFGGTSGASPIITGAALVVQGIFQNNFGFRLSPRQMRWMLSNPLTGTLPAVTETTELGVLPNLRLIIDTVLNLSPDVYLRDFVGDAGEPHNGPVSNSPDIILSKTDIANPQATFGAGSGTENDDTLGTDAEIGQDNFIYVRALNQGGTDATSVTASVYWSPPSTLITPDLWTLVGNVTMPNIPMGEFLTVSNKITWQQAAIPGEGHYCFIGLIGNTQDPAPDPADFLNWDNFIRFIKDNNNVTWKNFNVHDNDPDVDPSVPNGFFALPFLVPGALDKIRLFDLEIVSRLPKGSRIILEMPSLWKRALQFPIADFKYKLRKGYLPCNIKYSGKHVLNSIELNAKSKAHLRLMIFIPGEYKKGEYIIAVRQLWEKQEVGRISWKIVSPEKKKALEKRYAKK